MSNATNPSYVKAAFAAVGLGIPAPDAKLSFKEGCARMEFYRQNFQIALKRQQDLDVLGASTDSPRLPQPHWDGGSMYFYEREVEAYVAATRSE